MSPPAANRAQVAADPGFQELVQPHRRELFVHCYRMLGSLHDAEDALQESLVRAWQNLSKFEGRSSVRRWLYTIATRTCLDLIASRRARTLPLYSVDAGEPLQPPPAPTGEPTWLEPLPDSMLADAAPDPERALDARQSVALAFLAALQGLPPRQRGALILREVVGCSAEETAEILGMSVAAANSALQRAREGLGRRSALDADAQVDPSVLAKFVAAFESRDTEGLIALLRHDAAFSMPPMPLWLSGRDDIHAFVDGVLFRDPAMRTQKLVPTRANGAPAFGVYAQGEDGVFRPLALEVLTVKDGAIVELHAFLAADPSLDFAKFGLPPTL